MTAGGRGQQEAEDSRRQRTAGGRGQQEAEGSRRQRAMRMDWGPRKGNNYREQGLGNIPEG
jgi:hypothetical protein